MRYAIEACGLSKEYGRHDARESWLISALGKRVRSLVCRGEAPPLPGDAARPRHALADVSFAVEPGEAVALLGPNGAGKSTLLRILSRIIEPTCGRATVRGRLQALFEAGAGFERDLSGRDNIYLKAAVHNLPGHQTAKRFDRIVEFAGIEEVLDVPVKRYSSGQRNRLGIAVGLHLDHDVLVLDEAFSVVDDAFRARAFAVVREQQRRDGISVLLVSHEASHLQALCTRGLFLCAGKLVLDDALERSLSAARDSAAGTRSMAARSSAGA